MPAKRKSGGGDAKNAKAYKKDGAAAKVVGELHVAEICKWQFGCN